MSDRIFDTKNVILLKVNEDDLLSFLVDTDLLDSGEYDWRIDDLAEAILNVVPEYVFADYIGESVPVTKMIERLRESAKSIYKIKDYELMYRAYALHDEQAKQEVEDSGFKRRGEFGELLLHLLLREFKGTIPLVSKVYFKDSAGVPAHGFDAVHVSPNEGILWLGESKLYSDAKGGIKALLSDLGEHIRREYLDEQFIIIKKNLENNSIPQREYWINQLSSCSKLSERLKMINIPLLCVYPDDIYKDFVDVGDSQAFDVHIHDVKKLKQFFDEHNTHPLKSELNIILLLFSIKDKDEFLTKLHQKLWHMQNI